MNENIHWSEEMHVQNDQKVTVCCGIPGTLLEPYCLDATVNEVVRPYLDVTCNIMTFLV
jgi:hypothetical protein